MPFLEDENTYKSKIEKFAKEHPEATADDLAAIFPRMNNATAIWARFNASAKRNSSAKSGKTSAE